MYICVCGQLPLCAYQKHANQTPYTCANPAQGRRTGDGDCRTSSTETRRSQSAHSLLALPRLLPPLLLLLLPLVVVGPAGGSHAASRAGRSILRRRAGAGRVTGVGSVVIVGVEIHGFSIVTPSLSLVASYTGG